MKFTKLSLAAMAALSLASSAFAVENVKVDGQVKLWYQTAKADTAGAAELFDSKSATGDLVAKLRVTGDLSKKVGFGLTNYAMTTLGLESNLVGGVASGDATNAGTDKNPYWLGEAYMTYKVGNTLVKLGRMELDTPLAFTETWNAAPNAFEAALVVNSDIPNTTLIGAYVAKGNGNYSTTVNTDGSFKLGYMGTAALGSMDSGAYAVAMVNKSIPNLTLHPVYYNVQDVVGATWVDATYTGLPVKIEALYASLDVSENYSATADTTNGYAVQVSGKLANVDLSASYASIDSKGVLSISNTATNGGGYASLQGRKTKVYTATIASDGAYAGSVDSSSYKVTAATTVVGLGLSAAYGSYDLGTNNSTSKNGTSFTTSELDLGVTTKLDEVNVAAYYVKQTNFASGTSLVDRDIVRVIASINF